VLEWSEGDNWAITVGLPPGSFDFKFVVARADGSVAEWEPGSNRSVEVRRPQLRLSCRQKQVAGEPLETGATAKNTTRLLPPLEPARQSHNTGGRAVASMAFCMPMVWYSFPSGVSSVKMARRAMVLRPSVFPSVF
jgi:Starch binding domain